jgi:PAS domain-containing protein
MAYGEGFVIKKQSKPERFEERIDDMIQLIQYAKTQHEEAICLNEILQQMIRCAGGYLWYKDMELKYVYCDPSWCEVFYRMPPGCGLNLIGYTDKELLDEFRSNNRVHTFGEVCKGTDLHCIESKKQQHYIELGWIDTDLFVLDVVKTPVFNQDTIIGVVGFARDLSTESNWVCNELTRAFSNKEAEVVFKHNNDVAAYVIKRTNEEKQARKCMRHFPG